MKLHLAAFLVAAAATFAGPSTHRAEAQVAGHFGTPIVASSPVVPGPAAGGAMLGQASSFPYSYYAAFPDRARQYVPYGPTDLFPFHGNPYGRPNDRWTWEYMAGPPNSLQRYYYPPVR